VRAVDPARRPVRIETAAFGLCSSGASRLDPPVPSGLIGRTIGPAEADQIKAGAGSPGPRLGRPFGPGFALRPGLIGRKEEAPRKRGRASRTESETEG
jgi:hypothetical protein